MRGTYVVHGWSGEWSPKPGMAPGTEHGWIAVRTDIDSSGSEEKTAIAFCAETPLNEPKLCFQMGIVSENEMAKKYFAFVFLGADKNSDPDKEKKIIETENGGCIAVPVHNYEQAVEVCRKLADENLFAIELCGGFGHLGTARIVSAVEGKVPIGVVRFDLHPLFPEKGGDAVF